MNTHSSAATLPPAIKPNGARSVRKRRSQEEVALELSANTPEVSSPAQSDGMLPARGTQGPTEAVATDNAVPDGGELEIAAGSDPALSTIDPVRVAGFGTPVVASLTALGSVAAAVSLGGGYSAAAASGIRGSSQTLIPDDPERGPVEADPTNSEVTVTPSPIASDSGEAWTPDSDRSVDTSDVIEGQEEHRGPSTDIEAPRDIEAPEAPRAEVVGTPFGATAVINATGRVNVSGIEDGATWLFSIDGGQTWTVGRGNAIEAMDLNEGSNRALLVQVDQAGNRSTVSAIEVEKDTVAPETLHAEVVGTPEGTTPVINAGSSLNVSRLESGASWIFSVDGGQTWSAGQGTSVRAADLNEGSNTVHLVQMDKAGNRSSMSSIDVVKDTTAPLAPQIAGSESGPLIINGNGSVNISIEPGATWKFSQDGGVTWRTGVGSSIGASDLTEGSNKLMIIQTDSAGNSSESTHVDVVKDSVDPLAPVVGSDSMLINGSGSLSVTTEPGASWRFTTNGGQSWMDGQGSSILATDLREGHNTVQVVQIDAAGNVSAPALIEVTKDSIAPDAPGVPVGPLAINANGSVQVVVEPGLAWSFSVDGGQTWKSGTGSAITAEQLSEGKNNVEVVQSDAAGNISAASKIEVVKDTYVDVPWVFCTQYSEASGLQSFVSFGNLEAGAKWQYQWRDRGDWADGVGDRFLIPNIVSGDHLEIVHFRQVDAVGNVSITYNFGFYV